MTDWRLAAYESLPSTSDLCRTLAEAGEPDGLAVIARRQTAGRGSRGREWVAPEGNLNLSVLIRPRETLAAAAQWSLLAAVAVAEALEPVACQVKWPNDLLLDGRKVAGILLDGADDGAGGLAWLVIGMGVNLVAAPAFPGAGVVFSPPLMGGAGGEGPDRGILEGSPLPRPLPQGEGRRIAVRVLVRLAHWRRIRLLDGFAPIRAAWLARATPLGDPVSLRIGDQRLGGQFAGLGDDGSLLLRTGGRVHSFTTGEIMLGSA